MSLQDTDIAQIVSTIWQSILGIDCVQSTDEPGTPPKSITTCVQITGGWKGAIILGCPEAFAAQAASVMFGMCASQTTLTDMQDAVAELTNMIGGNVKGILPVSDACQLSLPAVVAGADFTTRVPGSRLVNRISLECGGHQVVVTVFEKTPAAVAA